MRTGEGMAVARAKGKLRGKQPKLSVKQQAALHRTHATGEYSIADLAELFSVSRPTAYRVLERRQVAEFGGNIVTAAMWQTLIGAAAAIVGALVGGFFGAWWQVRHGVALARTIRREERREASLFAWNAKVVEVTDGVDRAFRSAERDPAACPTAWADMHSQIEGLRATWESGVSGQIPDRSIVTKYLDVHGQAQDCVSRFGVPADPPVITATAQDFLRDAGRLLMLLSDLGKELVRTIDGLREV